MRLSFIVCCLLLSLAAHAEKPIWPDVQHGKNIPTLEQVVGHKSGTKLTRPDQVFSYIDALVAAAPERTRLVEYAQSWNGRPLKYLVVSSARNIQNLESNQQNMLRLADPRSYSEAEQSELVKQILPVSWLSYGVHGDEVSSTDAALRTAYHLLAAESDPTVDKILSESIVVLDPIQNPDGRARFIAHLEQAVGLSPAVHSLAAEHRQVWPGGRTNHYFFDMNRDWFAQTQPETQGRVKHYQKFFPVVHADIHEMGVDQTYYFPPPTVPYNPHISEQQKRNLNLYGQGNAEAFDGFQFDYFTREIFDAHYAGYGDTWPAFHGAVAMTFEASSALGLIQRNEKGQMVTYESGVQRHFVASIATLLTTASHGNRLLNDLADYRRTALEADQNYLFSGDLSLQAKLMEKLTGQGIEVHQVTEPTRVCGQARAPGSFVVTAGQPAGHLVRTLLDADSPIDSEFWREVESKRESGLPTDVYDVLAWSMPALYGLDVEICQKNIDGLVQYNGAVSQFNNWAEAKYGYLVENTTSASMAFLSDALRHGISVENTEAEFSIDAKTFERGTLLLKTVGLDSSAHKKIQALANEHAQDLVVLDSSWTSSGISFGSSQVKPLEAPKVALAWDYPTFSYSAGNTRYVIEQSLGYPVTPVRVPYLGSADMDYFDVIIIPDGGNYVSELGGSGVEQLKRWVKNGGVLITLGGGTRLLIDESVALLDSKLEANIQASESNEAASASPGLVIESKDDYLAIIGKGVQRPEFMPGVIVKGQSDANHWLTAGVADTLYMLVGGRDIYTPLQFTQGTNVVRFADQSELLHGGYLWTENQSQLAYKPAVMSTDYGSGSVVGFVVNPTYRGFMDGFHVMLGNAIFKGPSR